MARSNESFNRRERERAKKQKADAKRQRRLTRPESDDGDESTTEAADQPVDQGALLQRLAELNEAFEAGNLTFEDFDEQRAELIALIAVD